MRLFTIFSFDRFAKIYTPVVFAVAILVPLSGPLLFHGAWLEWTYRSLVLLVIACPCALVISTPVSMVSGLTAMARRGVLIKGGVFLEEIGKLKALAVDKTGTITEGKPSVQQVIPCGKSEEEILRVAAAIDTHSEHRLAQAVVKYAEEKKIEFPRSENYQSKTGRSAEARIDGHLYFVGNHRSAHESAVCSDELEEKLGEIEAQAMSVVIVGHKPHEGCKGEVLGILAVGDTIRPNDIENPKSLDTDHPSSLLFTGRYQLPITLSVMIDRDFMRGFVKLYTLWRASKGEVYGMEIMQEMRELGFTLSPGTLYPTLHALLKERDVTVTNRLVKGKIRKCYRATAKGRKEVEEVIERLSFLIRKVFR